jgi:5-formyltetrahydrofolate cyclo-ligase
MRQAMTADFVTSKSRVIAEKLAAFDSFASAGCVMLYHPFDNEVYLDTLIEECLATGKTVLLPRCKPIDRTMEACTITNITTDLIPGTYEVMEPHRGIPASKELELIDICVVPGVAFDRQGNRMGRGAGYYDRFLARLGPRTLKIAVAFTQQIIESVPHTDHDIKMDMIITEDELIFAPVLK